MQTWPMILDIAFIVLFGLPVCINPFFSTEQAYEVLHRAPEDGRASYWHIAVGKPLQGKQGLHCSLRKKTLI